MTVGTTIGSNKDEKKKKKRIRIGKQHGAFQRQTTQDSTQQQWQRGSSSV